jgi:hypothetical protein
MIQSGQLDPATHLATACFKYLRGQAKPVTAASVETDAGGFDTAALVAIETDHDMTLMLPVLLRGSFKEGFLFTVRDGVVCKGWREDNERYNYRVEWVEFAADRLSGNATIMSEASIAYWKEQEDQRAQRARRRAGFAKQAKAGQEAVLPGLLASANVVLEEHRAQLSDEGLAELQAYIARLPWRFSTTTADRMMETGASLKEGLADAVQYLVGQTEKKVGVMLGLRRYRRQ